MSLVVSEMQPSPPVLPHDVFEQHILPLVLSKHLHALLVEPGPLDWHAFYVLPQVCRSFYTICRSLFPKIFVGVQQGSSDDQNAPDLESADDPDDPDDFDSRGALNYAISTWDSARRPSKTFQWHQHDRATLLTQKGLIGVYTCLALGKMFLNVDVLLPLGAATETNGPIPTEARGRRSMWDEDYDDAIEEQHGSSPLDETNMHRSYMPFESAQRLCDLILPKALSFVVADYMAHELPLYHALPLLAKHAADLRFNVAREHKLELEEYAEWTLHVLTKLEGTEGALVERMKTGILVRSFWAHERIPREALKLTGIISALDDVVGAEWGSATNNTRRKASALIRRWTA